MDAAAGLSPHDVRSVESLISADERLVAFETLCTQICEWEVSLPSDVVRDLEQLGLALGARPSLTDHLWEDVQDA